MSLQIDNFFLHTSPHMSVVNHSYGKMTFVCFKIDQVGSIPDWCESPCDHNILDHSEPPGGSQAVDHLFFFSSKKIIYRVTVWPDRYFSNVGPFVGFLEGDLLPPSSFLTMYLSRLKHTHTHTHSRTHARTNTSVY